MSNGINQNATCYKTASAQEERLLYPCAQGCAVPRAAHPPQLRFPGLPGTPWSQARASTSRAPSGAGTGRPAPGSCAGLGGCVGRGGPAVPCPGPQPFSGDQVWDSSFGGHNWLLCLSPGSSQVALIAVNLFNCQKYNRSTVPSVLGREVCPVSRRLVNGSLWSCVHLQHPQPQRPSAAHAGSPAALAMPVPGSQERGCGLGAAGPG